MRYGSVCSGIEAATAAWHPLGWEPAFFSEIEPFPRAVLQHHYPGVPLHGDFTTIEGDDYGAIDLLVGGTPCQSFSIAGLRGGLDDDRGNLALEFLRLAQRKRPKWLVWENVPGVLSSNGGRDFGSILGGMVECGYGFAYRVLDAQYFGVAQRRRRVFVIGCLGDATSAAAVLFERHSLQGHSSPRRKKAEEVAGTITRSSFSGGAGGKPEGAAVNHFVPDVSKCLTTRTGGCFDPEMETFPIIGGIDYENNAHGADDPTGPLLKGSPTGGGRPLPVVAFEWQRGASQNIEFTDDFSPALIKSQTPAVAIPINTQLGLRGPDNANSKRKGVGVGNEGDTSFTLQRSHSHAVATQSAVRRLTPIECERLQGFQDNYTSIPWRNKSADECPDGPRYKALGNSMAVPVMRWIGERINEVEKIK